MTGNVINSVKKTGFLGFFNDLQNVFEIWKNYIIPNGYQYLLTYKLLQDFLETYFGSIRSRDGFNNNPDAYQFQTAYRMLLIHNETQASENANIEILSVSSGRKEQ